MSLAPSFFEQFEDRLNLAVFDINQEIEMGVYHLNETFAGTWPGGVTMVYGAGGKTEIYSAGDNEVEVPAGSSPDSISEALQNPFQFKKKPSEWR